MDVVAPVASATVHSVDDFQPEEGIDASFLDDNDVAKSQVPGRAVVSKKEPLSDRLFLIMSMHEKSSYLSSCGLGILELRADR